MACPEVRLLWDRKGEGCYYGGWWYSRGFGKLALVSKRLMWWPWF